jgi:hypothetical protein
MVYIVSICAKQSEDINAALPEKAVNNPYHLMDVLPRMEADLETRKYKEGLGRGTKDVMRHLIGTNSDAYEAIEKVAWGKETMFGKVVCCDRLHLLTHF